MRLDCILKKRLLRFAENLVGLMLLFIYFLVLFISLTALFSTIHGLTVLFQLTFTFIYDIFSNKFLISTK